METFTVLGEDAVSRGRLALALGNFDGLHQGHRAVIASASRLALRLDARLCVGTFVPLPARFFNPDMPPFRIMSERQRGLTLERLGVECLALIPFNQTLAAMTDRAFVDTLAASGAVAVSIGYDFRFGRGRMGDAEAMLSLCEGHGIAAEIVPKVAGAEEKISSTQIRELIRQGEMEAAERLLLRPWTVDAEVVHGEKRGRTLGFPTANLYPQDLIAPRFGVYAVFARIAGETVWREGVASFGRTPTTGLRDPLLEVHLADFEGDLYGRRLDVAFKAFLRPEIRFEGLSPLVEQMNADLAQAIRILRSAEPPAF
jgi:riboflavin kinase/FMN adenylyltransferase